MRPIAGYLLLVFWAATRKSDFYKDWSKRLIGPQSAAAYHGMESEMGARQQAHVDSIKRANEEAQAHTTNAQGLSNDPTAVATRRCLELGGNPAACMGKSFVGGLMSMVGFDSSTMQAVTGPSRSGVVLSGQYRSCSALPSISFGTDSSPQSRTRQARRRRSPLQPSQRPQLARSRHPQRTQPNPSFHAS